MPLLSLRGVCKRFGTVQALSSIDLDVHAGEIVALVGDNGAGKSTLVKTIAGVNPPDTGEIRWRGRPVAIRRPHDAQDLGIATVYQDLALCESLDAVANLYLGHELRRFGLLREVEMERRSRAVLEGLSVRLASVRIPVASLSGGQRQAVAIARSLIGRPELVILDEPTAALGLEQSAQTLDMIRRLREQGHAVILVTHNLDDVQAVADRVAVLRLGRNNGFFEVRYTTQEQITSAITGSHAMAVTLQQSLLPRGLPEQSAVDAAYRYLPAHAGVGGDWFDVIPLSGARVALVVGDVVGHGLHAAATMGRLRTAVHNFSALDLPPDELLTHLDDVVSRIDQEEAANGAESAIIGATCLYAIYDPATRRCQLARAGHLPAVLVHGDGTVEIPDTPVGPPLGLRGLPFTTAELELPEGSQLVLFTDGLVEARTRDIDIGLDLLRAALAHPGRSPEETCQAVLEALLPSRPEDDVALLVARTRGLPVERIAEWDVPTDPAAVAAARATATRQLEAWGLDALVFSTELILSELVTNAIRHAAGPIRIRLLHDRALICEVGDSGSTSPHLRNASATDEGGRGLFLVAQLSERWGTRYTPEGKVIWAEQNLPRTRS
ncbi:SpoIIE family protein phosphatase [Kitasatospora sp. NBC_01539]|uniref:SpoIIE family protein phosphatase n=1 Tax=Kitasatospora sp. NBC_01539 TaxID=2903577 RepID=UPI0038600FB2